MKIIYFSDTDTALIQFSDRVVVETREISEEAYADLDAEGHIISLTIEHARMRARWPELECEEVGKRA